MSAVTTTPPPGSFTREAFAAHLDRVKHLPAWWLDRKRAAYERFASLPMPKRTNEGWRFSNLSTLTLDGFQVGRYVPTELPVPPFARIAPASLTFVNNTFTTRTGPAAEIAAEHGIIFDTLQHALARHTDL